MKMRLHVDGSCVPPNWPHGPSDDQRLSLPPVPYNKYERLTADYEELR